MHKYITRRCTIIGAKALGLGAARLDLGAITVSKRHLFWFMNHILMYLFLYICLVSLPAPYHCLSYQPNLHVYIMDMHAI